MTPEQVAREEITRMIEAAGWNYRGEALTGRLGGTGIADYLLLEGDGQAVGLLEAKHAGIPPLSGKEQAREYADSIGVGHVLLSNGDLHTIIGSRTRATRFAFWHSPNLASSTKSA